MNISKKSSLALGLWENEVAILKTLSTEELMISEISTAAAIPRTSLYYILNKLEQRGLVEKSKRNKKIYWKTSANNPLEVLGNISSEAQISLHYGNENVLNVFREISAMPAKSRFYGIQPEQSLIAAVTRNPIEDILNFNRKVNAKKLIVEGIIHEKGTDSMVKALPKEDGRKLLKSFANRSADTARLPDNFLDKTKAEIYLYEDKIALVNWQEEFAVIIKNKDVFELIKEMFNSTKYLLERYDQNEKVARRLIDLEEGKLN